jgi:ATP-dependent helicase HrpA
LPYLLPKVKVFADNGLTGEPIIESRDWKALQFGLSKNLKAVQRDFALSDRGQILWQKACQSFEKENIQASEIGDLPRSMVIGVVNGVEILAYPGFRVEAALVALRLFHEEIEAQREGVLGYRYLLKKALSSDFKLFNKELSVLGRLGMDYMSLGSLDDLKGDILEAIEAEFINIIVPWPIQAAGFREQVNRVAFILRGLPLKIGDQLKSILKIYHSLLQKSTVLGDLISDVRALIYPHFLKYTPFSQWPYLELYLKAIDVRANRRLTNPQKDIERFRLVQPWILAYERLSKTPLTGLKKRKLIHYQWAVEMYKVSVFAQDLKVPESISPKRLEDILGHIEG